VACVRDIIEQPVDLTTLTPRYTQRAIAILESAAGIAPALNVTPAPKPGQPFFLCDVASCNTAMLRRCGEHM
jgi:hypothetical protein